MANLTPRDTKRITALTLATRIRLAPKDATPTAAEVVDDAGVLYEFLVKGQAPGDPDLDGRVS